MSFVYGEPDPQPASATRASQSVAPIATPASEISQQSNRTPARNATRATPKRSMDNEPAIPVDTPTVMDDTIISEYEEVFKLLTENPPEQILDVQVPYSKYNQMEATFSRIKADKNISEDQRYPYLEYNNFTETLTVVTIPNSIHEVAVYELNFDIMAGANDYLSEHAPGLMDRILPLGSTTTIDFDGDYSNSSKQPDGGIKYAIAAESNVMIAIEVGISQSYKSLCDAKDMWINGHHVKVCVLVCLNESPRFKNPTTAYDSIEDVRTEMATMKQSVAEQMRGYKSRGYYGPIVYRRHKWTGTLNEAFIEIWRAGNTIPERYELTQAGVACPNLPTTLGLKISDMVSDEAWEAVGVPDREIRFNGARFVGKLVNAVLDTAKERFFKFIRFPEN
ncbi:hypothetical protein V1527DRAFT_485743 [Lipomyces starkeyi]